MKYIKNTTILILLVFTFVNSCANKENLISDNLDNMIEAGDAEWNYSKGILTAKVDNGKGFIISDKSYDDFVLELDFKPDSTINSGVFIRCANQEISPFDCYEVNIWDLHPNQNHRTGAIVQKTTPLKTIETIDKWNNLKIKCIDNQIKVWINDIIISDLKDDDLKSGYIGFQAFESGEISFKNILINESIK